MVQNAGLMLGDGLAGLVFSQVLTMAGEEDCRISIEQTSDFQVQHGLQSEGNSLKCQTNVFKKYERGYLGVIRRRPGQFSGPTCVDGGPKFKLNPVQLSG